MIAKAKEVDPSGDYRLPERGDVTQFQRGAHDLVLSAFTFDNIVTMQKKVTLFRELGALLNRDGCIVNVVSSPEIYVHEWASFSTKDFPENRLAISGDVVRIITTDYQDRRAVADILWTDESYREVYREAGLQSIRTYQPLATGGEPYEWVNETKIAPWVIYVLMRRAYPEKLERPLARHRTQRRHLPPWRAEPWRIRRLSRRSYVVQEGNGVLSKSLKA